MEKYLKMSDVFFATVEPQQLSGWKHQGRYVELKRIQEAAAHAINSHDELVAMNKELLSALEFVIEDKAPGYHDCTDDGESECGWCVARKAIAKAKAAS